MTMQEDLRRLIITTVELPETVVTHLTSIECIKLDLLANWAEKVEDATTQLFAGTELGTVANKAKNA